MSASAAAFECPMCPTCGQPAGTADNPDVDYGELICTVCRHIWKATAAEIEQAARADAAYGVLVDQLEATMIRKPLDGSGGRPAPPPPGAACPSDQTPAQ